MPGACFAVGCSVRLAEVTLIPIRVIRRRRGGRRRQRAGRVNTGRSYDADSFRQ